MDFQRRSRSEFLCFWKSQDYPHPTSIPNPFGGGSIDYFYDPDLTVKARARVRMHPTAVDNTRNWTFSEVRDFEESYFAKLTKPLYQLPKWRWIFPLFIDPDELNPPRLWSPLDRATPTDQVASSFDWNLGWGDPMFATRGLISTATPVDTGLASRSMSTLVQGGDPYHALQTVGFAACQQGEAGFLFGGQNGQGGLQSGLWFVTGPGDGQQTIERIGPEPGGGAMAMSTPTTPSNTPAKSTTPKATPAFSAWAKNHPPKKSRPTLAKLLKQVQAKPASMASGGGASGAATMSSGAGTSFSADPPAGQMQSVLVHSPDWATVTALFGDQGTSPSASGSSLVGIFDVTTGDWTSGTADWTASCGARRWVAAAGLNPAEIVVYGGDQDGSPVAGLYRVSLDPGSLLDGTPPVWLDSGSADSPGPRSRAVMAYDPLAEAGAGRLYLYGGLDSSGTTPSDLWAFSLTSGEWTLLADDQAPNAPPTMVPGGLLVRSLDGHAVLFAGTDAGSGQVAAYRYDPNSGWTTHDWPDTP